MSDSSNTLNSELSILYVEDDPKSRDVLRMYLTLQFKLKHLTIFEDSANFIQRVEALSPQPDVILLDIHVAPLTGFQMLQMLREHSRLKDIPVVALTASVMNEEVHALREAGFNGCLGKPLDMKIFPECVLRIMNGERLWRIL